MAVYTHVSRDDLIAHLARYDVGTFVSYRGVTQGVENTNYIIETAAPDGDGGDPRVTRRILTLFERRTRREDLPFFLGAMDHFANHGEPTPRVAPLRDGALIADLCGRPAVIISFLPGAPRMTPGPDEAAAVGATLARLHRAGADFPMTRANDLALDGWRTLAEDCRAGADACAPGLAALIDDELAWQTAAATSLDAHMPRGLVHTDLFPDNVFFDGADVSGVIDFYFSCTDYFVYDLAVGFNAWCSDNGVWRPDNADALMSSYAAGRALGEAERDSLTVFLRGSALRFLLTRLYDWINQVDGADVRVKDPLEFRDLLLRHREHGADWL